MMDVRTDAQRIVNAAADAFQKRGIEFSTPWDGDLDDLERERFDALCEAVSAVLAFAKSHLSHQPSFGDGKWAARHLDVLTPETRS